jgi:hypothetical protein
MTYGVAAKITIAPPGGMVRRKKAQASLQQ